MLSVRSDTVSEHLSDYLDSVSNGETIVISRESKPDVALITLSSLQDMRSRIQDMEKQIKNYQYLAEIEKAFKELEAGHFQVHDLIED